MGLSIETLALSKKYTDSQITSVSSGIKNVITDNEDCTITIVLQDDTIRVLEIEKPSPGISVTGASIDSDNNLILSYSDGTTSPPLHITTLQGEKGDNGENGTNGVDGISPHIDSTTGRWFIGDFDTGVNARVPSTYDYSNLTNTPTIPTAVSDLVNDVDYQTADQINAVLEGYATSNDLSNHTSNDNIHVTSIEKSTWNDKYTKNEVDNKFSTLESAIDWKESVETYDDIAITYTTPQDGWTVNVKDTNYTYRYNGTEWVAISANAIPKATASVDGLMDSMDKSKLDGIESNAQVNTITGIKGNNETVYRTGNVNITPENIGALSSDGNAVSATRAMQDGDGNNIADTYFNKSNILNTVEQVSTVTELGKVADALVVKSVSEDVSELSEKVGFSIVSISKILSDNDLTPSDLLTKNTNDILLLMPSNSIVAWNYNSSNNKLTDAISSTATIRITKIDSSKGLVEIFTSGTCQYYYKSANVNSGIETTPYTSTANNFGSVGRYDDFDNFKTPGIYDFYGSGTNTPANNDWGMLFVTNRNACSRTFQFAITFRYSKKMYVRSYDYATSTWDAWTAI